MHRYQQLFLMELFTARDKAQTPRRDRLLGSLTCWVCTGRLWGPQLSLTALQRLEKALSSLPVPTCHLIERRLVYMQAMLLDPLCSLLRMYDQVQSHHSMQTSHSNGAELMFAALRGS